ncbi:MAG TPA: exo-alpha-sialidase [Roseiflexaceae bacterium]|nr:exo-alpha-sialidase [Roseiflexaceae bacterium]
MYRELRDGKWSPVNDVVAAGTGGYTVRNSMVLGRDGRLHVLMRNHTRIEHVSAPWEKAWTAASWGEARGITADGAYYVALGVDSNNTLHAFWSQALVDDPQHPRPECPNCANLFYRRSSDGGLTWSAIVNLSHSSDGDNRPQVKVDRQDRIHVVWDQGEDWYAGAGTPKRGIYRRSDDGGKSWRPPVEFVVPDDAVQQTTLAVTPEGNPMVVYRTVTGKIYYQTSLDGGDTWAPPARLPGVVARDTIGNSLDQYSMESDSAGNVHLLMVGYLDTVVNPELRPPSLFHLTWNGTLWSAPETVMSNELYPEWPVLVVGGGNQLHAVWYTRNADDRLNSERARYRIWYSGRRVGAPATTPLPLFTPQPTAEPTVEATTVPTPTRTAVPASFAEIPPPDGPPRWETRSLSTIALALLPIGLMVAGLFLVRRLRQ